MRSLLLTLAAALLLPSALPGVVVAQETPSAIAGAPDMLAQHMAAPFASGLTGAADAPIFAWIENRAGARTIWTGGSGQPSRAVTQDNGDDGVELSGLALSPDGTQLAFVRGGDAEWPGRAPPNPGLAPIAPRPTLWLLQLDGGGTPVRIGEGQGAVFSADGRQIAFAQGSAVWLWDGTEARRIAQLAGTAGDLAFSPDGTRLLLQDGRSGHSLVAILPLDGGPLTYLAATLGYQSEPVWSPDGLEIAWIQFYTPPDSAEDATIGERSWWSVRVADAATGAVRVAWSAEPGEGGQFYGTRGQNLFWSGTGRLLFPSERSGWLHVLSVDAAGGSATDLTPDANEVEHFQPTPDGQGLIYTANPGNGPEALDARQVWRVPLAGGAAERLTSNDRLAFMPTVAGDQVAAMIADGDSPVHPVLLDGLAPLGTAQDLPGMVEPEVVSYIAADGVRVNAQLFRSPGAGPHPAVVFVHGGPRRQMLPGFHPYYYYHNAYLMNQALARAGYHVLSVNYRSGTNYGRAFREAAERGRAGASEYRDVLAAGEWLAAQPFVDRERIGIWGGSWGGYLTALALARDSDLFAAGVDLHGVHTLLRPAGTTLAPAEAERVRQVQWDSSPLGAIAGWRSPVLLVHGDDDANVGFEQSLLLARELTAQGVVWEELVWPNERHDFFQSGNWLATYRATLDFFDRHLKRGEQP